MHAGFNHFATNTLDIVARISALREPQSKNALRLTILETKLFGVGKWLASSNAGRNGDTDHADHFENK